VGGPPVSAQIDMWPREYVEANPKGRRIEDG
jgi:hypothetical protein